MLGRWPGTGGCGEQGVGFENQEGYVRQRSGNEGSPRHHRGI